MRELLTIIKSLGLGAGLMYLLDPDAGALRRAKFRRQALEVAVAAGDEADRLFVAAGHKLAEQGCQLRAQFMQAVTGNGRHPDPPIASTAEAAHFAETENVAASACPMANSRLLTGLGGSVLVAYGLRSRSPWAIAATAVGVVLVAKAMLQERQELSPNELHPEQEPPISPADPATQSRWDVAQP